MHVALREADPAVAPLALGSTFRRIPDPFTISAEGIRLQSEAQAAEDAIWDWCERAHACLSFLAATDPSRIWIWREKVLPILLAGDLLRLCRAQRFGHGCDRLARQMAAQRLADDRFGRIVDAWTLEQPALKSIRSEAAVVESFLLRTARANAGIQPISIVSLGCAPLALSPAAVRCMHLTFADNEESALREVARNAAAKGASTTTVHADLANMTSANGLARDHAAFCALHALNYLSDAAAIKLLELVHSKLRPAGRLLLGSFQRAYPNAALFEHALSWPLLGRSEAELLRLIKKTKFAACAVTVTADPEGAQLFVECRKSAV
jgi:SAM-dependent methyltransferase